MKFDNLILINNNKILKNIDLIWYPNTWKEGAEPWESNQYNAISIDINNDFYGGDFYAIN